MDVKLANELGMRNVDYYRPVSQSVQPLENPANIPGVHTADRQMADQQQEMTSLSPNASSDRYQMIGATINVMA